VCGCFLFLCEKQNTFFFDLACRNPPYGNLYSEFPLKARVFKWVPALELWEDSEVGICGLAVLLTWEKICHQRRHPINHCSVSRTEAEAGTFPGRQD